MNIKKLGTIAFVAVISALVTVGATQYFIKKSEPTNFEDKQAAARFTQVSYGTTNQFSGMVDFTQAAKITTPGVVHIKTSYAPKNVSHDYNPFRDFFGNDWANPFGQIEQQPSESSGSGVIISDDGYIVTNNHVVEDGDKFEVILADKESFEGKVIGTDPATDLALVKIDANNLPFIRFGNSDSVEVGQWVLAVGNPFNLESTVTAGIVSAKGRNIGIIKTKDDNGQASNGIESFIQTDAAVNPGNSGGALVDLSGSLIGINSAIATPTGTFAGYSFAVPVNIVKKVVDDLLKYGMVQRGYLGVSIASINADLAKQENISVLKGVYVDSVYPGSAAEDAGLKDGDVITKINDVEVNSSPELQEQVSRFHPGDKVTVVYLRGGKEKTAVATLKNKQGNTDYLKKEETTSLDVLGATFSELTEKEKKDMGIDGGVKVVTLNDGKLSRNTNMKEGFVITKVDSKVINNIADLKDAFDNKKGGVLIEGRYPDYPGVYYYAFGM